MIYLGCLRTHFEKKIVDKVMTTTTTTISITAKIKGSLVAIMIERMNIWMAGSGVVGLHRDERQNQM